MPNNPTILFEDKNIIVLSKPAGLLSQGEHKNDPNLVDWLRQYLGRKYVGLVHRLDRNTSGAMVVAKRTKAARRLTESLQSGKLNRMYLAWIEGTLKYKVKWTHWLLKDTEKNKTQVVSDTNKNAKKAVLSISPVSYGILNKKYITLVKLKLETGRSHQIRVQLAYEGYPVLGDTKYGKFFKKEFRRTALHSSSVSFPHPITGEEMSFDAELPDDMKKIKRKSKN